MKQNGFIGLVLVLVLLAAGLAFFVYPDEVRQTTSRWSEAARRQTSRLAAGVTESVQDIERDFGWNSGTRRSTARGRLREH